jgi:hypothetical protein
MNALAPALLFRYVEIEQAWRRFLKKEKRCETLCMLFEPVV